MMADFYYVETWVNPCEVKMKILTPLYQLNGLCACLWQRVVNPGSYWCRPKNEHNHESGVDVLIWLTGVELYLEEFKYRMRCGNTLLEEKIYYVLVWMRGFIIFYPLEDNLSFILS